MKKKKIIAIISIALIIICIIVAIIFNILEDNSDSIKLKDVFYIEDIETSKYETRKSTEENVASIYYSILNKSEEKELIILNANAVIGEIKGKMIYARSKAYKKEVNVFGLTEIESINRVGIEKLATLEDIPIN